MYSQITKDIYTNEVNTIRIIFSLNAMNKKLTVHHISHSDLDRNKH